MNILYAQTMIFPNSSAHAIHTSMLAANFAAAGAHVSFFPGLNRKHDPQILEDFYTNLGASGHAGLVLKRIPFSHKGLYGSCFRYVLWKEALMKRDQDTVFFASSVKEAVMALNIRALVPGKKKIPVVFEVHHLISVLKGGKEARRLYKQEKKAFEQSDLVVFISETLRKDAEGYLPTPRQAIVSPLGFNDRTIASLPKPSRRNGEKHIVYLGSLQPGKGLDELIEALALLPGNYHLKIIGGRPESSLVALRNRASLLGLQNRVVFLGQVLHRDIAEKLSGCDLFIIPLNAQKNFYCPIKMYEAVGYALPIVSTPLPSIQEILAADKNALFSENTSPEALANALYTLGENEELQCGMRRANAALAETLKASVRAKFLLEEIRMKCLAAGL